MGIILVSWLGRTDLDAVTKSEEVGLGPVAQALQTGRFARLELICDFPPAEAVPYLAWLQGVVPTPVTPHYVTLANPTDFGGIYRHARQLVAETIAGQQNGDSLAFHLSPGTPAMAAVWIILAKTRFPAELIESSKKHGVRTASVPFDISADFLPDLLARPDRELERLTAGLAPEAPEFSAIIHRSPVMQRVIARARRVAPRSIPVLIEGESGTGKELLARAIHQASPRRERPFITVNCGAIAPELVESELFGHEKGAFTGAMSAAPRLLRGRPHRHPLPGRDRRAAQARPGQAPARPPGGRGHPRRCHRPDGRRCPHPRRHQPHPDRRGRPRPLPRRPLLSPGRRRHPPAAAPRARGRRRPAARPAPGPGQPRERDRAGLCPQETFSRRKKASDRAPLARQRPRDAQHLAPRRCLVHRTDHRRG